MSKQDKKQTKKYFVRLRPQFSVQPTHWRVGRQFVKGVPQILDLTSEEVEEVENDRYMEIRSPKKNELKAETGSSDANTSGNSGSENSEDSGDDTADEAGENTDAGDEEESSDETQKSPEQEEADKLNRENNINQLRKIAKEVGVKDANKKSKPVLALAIVKAKADAANGEEESSDEDKG